MKISPLLMGATVPALACVVPVQAAAKWPAANTTAAKTTATRSWVTLKAATDKARYSPGEPIQVRLTATNTFKRGAYLRFTSGQRFDFSVYRVGQADSVYTWSASRMFVQALGSLWLKPGQSQRFNASIGDEMGQLWPGKYRLLARLTNSPRPIMAAPIEFEIKSEVAHSTLSMTARTDKTRYKIGEPVQVNVAVTNVADKAVPVMFHSGLACDVFITDAAGKAIWNYGANLRFIRALGEVTWQKGRNKNLFGHLGWRGFARRCDPYQN